MGGGGGLEPVSRKNPDWYQAVRSVDREKYEAITNEFLREIGSELGERDDATIHQHVAVLRDKLQNDLAETIDVEFGGSLSKHTYVDGLSDIDALVLLPRSEAQDSTPEELIGQMAGLVRDRLPETEVRTGRMAVTVTYSDGAELQLLPAIKRGDRVQVPAGGGGGWSPIADPKAFAQSLKNTNARNSFAVVPVIKLFKAIQDTKIPEDAHLSGYHIEAIAVAAFSNYQGPMERKAMLEHFVNFAAGRVLRPVTDVTGQTEHVDDYLGPADSTSRRKTAAYLDRLRARMMAADRSGDSDAWTSLFGSE